jgi:hypothetical protein
LKTDKVKRNVDNITDEHLSRFYKRILEE